MKARMKEQFRHFLITISIITVVTITMSALGLLPEQDPFPRNARIRITATGEEAIVSFACRRRDGRWQGECRGHNMAVTEDNDYWFLRLIGNDSIDTNWNNGIYIQWRDFEIIDY